MTKAAKVLLTKYAMTFILAVMTLKLMDRNPWLWIIALSITLATINYLIGDYFVLRRFGNATASLTNGLLAALGTYFVSILFYAFETRIVTILVFAVLIVVAEYIFHRYLMDSEEVMP